MNLGDKYKLCVKSLEGHSDSPELDTSLFFEEVCSLTKSALVLHASAPLKDEDEKKIDSLVSRRLNGEPVAYILGHKGFYKAEFCTPKGVLIPQPDTETLVESTLSASLTFPDKEELHLLDLCAGTGCVGISVAMELYKNKTVELYLSDMSEEAYLSFSKNAKALLPSAVKTHLILSDLFEGVKGKKFQIITSNPPYIKTEVIDTLSPEVKAEPLLALDGGEDGLVLIRRIISEAPSFLAQGGYLLLEIGYDQGEEVKKLFTDNHFTDVEIKKDLGGRDRVVLGKVSSCQKGL